MAREGKGKGRGRGRVTYSTAEQDSGEWRYDPLNGWYERLNTYTDDYVGVGNGGFDDYSIVYVQRAGQQPLEWLREQSGNSACH